MNEWVKGALKSRTMWFSLALALFGALEAASGLVRESLQSVFGSSTVAVVLLTISVVTAVLRVVTTMPLSEK